MGAAGEGFPPGKASRSRVAGLGRSRVTGSGDEDVFQDGSDLQRETTEAYRIDTEGCE